MSFHFPCRCFQANGAVVLTGGAVAVHVDGQWFQAETSGEDVLDVPGAAVNKLTLVESWQHTGTDSVFNLNYQEFYLGWMADETPVVTTFRFRLLDSRDTGMSKCRCSSARTDLSVSPLEIGVTHMCS